MRNLALTVTLAALWIPRGALAAETFLQNDSFTGSSQVNASMTFGAYGGAGVVLQPDDPSQYPVTISAIDILYLPINGGTPADAWDLDIFSIPDGGVLDIQRASFAGDLYSTSQDQTSVQLATSTTQFNRFNLPSPLTVSAPVLVRLRQSYDSTDPDTGFSYYGTIALDTSPTVPGANWYYGADVFQDMTDPDAGFPAGNWIIRGVIEVDGGPATTSTSTSSTTASSSTASSTGSTTTGAGTTGTTTTGTTTTGTTTSGAGTTTSGTTTSTTTGSTTGTSGTLTLTSVAPTSAFTDDDTQVTLVGSNFAIGVQALIGPTPLDDIQLRSPAVLVATLPHGTAPGTYDVTVINPDGAQASLSNAFTIEAG